MSASDARSERRGLRARWCAWRLRRAEDELADAEHDLVEWGDHFGIKPSRKRLMRERVERAERRLAALGVDTETADD